MHLDLICCLIVFFLATFAKGQFLPVMTSKGVLNGRSVSMDGQQFGLFLGIPYAKPPIGDRRFSAPEPPDSWPQPRDASRYSSRCPQLSSPMMSSSDQMGEDCLYLNVYSPGISTQSPTSQTLYPVMVYLHGGGFVSGSGDDLEEESVLRQVVSKGIVFVSINYRLGLLGFWSTDSVTAPGNYGLWDQGLALKWIKDEIHIFAGDPSQVTILGHSSGAMSASLLSLSPLTKNFFQRGILMSGSGLSKTVVASYPQLWLAVAELSNCGRANLFPGRGFPQFVPPNLAGGTTTQPKSAQAPLIQNFKYNDPHAWKSLWTSVKTAVEGWLGNMMNKVQHKDKSVLSAQSNPLLESAPSMGGALDGMKGIDELFTINNVDPDWNRRLLECMRIAPLQLLLEAQRTVQIGKWRPREDGILFPKPIADLATDRTRFDAIIGTTDGETAGFAFQALQQGKPLVTTAAAFYNNSIKSVISANNLKNPGIMTKVFEYKYVDEIKAKVLDNELPTQPGTGVPEIVWFAQDVKLQSSVQFWMPSALEAISLAKNPSNKVYLYSFDYVSELENFPVANWKGATHMSILKYLFDARANQRNPRRQVNYRGPLNAPVTNPNLSPADGTMRNLITSLFMNFVRSGNPNGNTAATPYANPNSTGLTWINTDPKILNYLSFGSPTMMRNGYHADEVLFWQRLVKPLESQICL